MAGGTVWFAMLCLVVGCFMLPAAAGAATVWNVSHVAGAGNYTSLLDISVIGEGDTIRIWGVEGHTYEGGITIITSGVTVERWEGSPARPIITNSSHTAPAITVTAGGITLQGLNVSGNSLDSGNGAAIRVGGTRYAHLLGFTVTDCVFTGNEAAGGSGGAVSLEYVDDSRIAGTTFTNNTAGNYGGRPCYGGGAYFIHSASPTLTNTTFADNTALAGGGAFFTNSTSPTLTNTTFENNTAKYGGGGAYFGSSASPTLTDTTFENNMAGANGGGTYLWSSNTAALIGTTFANNTAADGGGGAYFTDSISAVITNCRFDSPTNIYAKASGAVLNGTRTVGTNIAGGPYLGGNLWLTDPAQNISGWGTDADFDGICDEAFIINNSDGSVFGIDHLPLVVPGGGTATINSTPAGASIRLDGVELARTTNTSLYLPAGDHDLTVTLDGYVTPENRTVTITAGQTVPVSFSLDPVPTRLHSSGDGRSHGRR